MNFMEHNEGIVDIDKRIPTLEIDKSSIMLPYTKLTNKRLLEDNVEISAKAEQILVVCTEDNLGNINIDITESGGEEPTTTDVYIGKPQEVNLQEKRKLKQLVETTLGVFTYYIISKTDYLENSLVERKINTSNAALVCQNPKGLKSGVHNVSFQVARPVLS